MAIVLLLAALAYVLYLWSKRKEQIPCPSCGARVNMYGDECPHCGHEKDGIDEPATDSSKADTADVSEVEADDDTDYEGVVQGTIPEVKEAVQNRDLDLVEVLKAEKENKDRVTLKDWLEDRLADEN